MGTRTVLDFSCIQFKSHFFLSRGLEGMRAGTGGCGAADAFSIHICNDNCIPALKALFTVPKIRLHSQNALETPELYRVGQDLP